MMKASDPTFWCYINDKDENMTREEILTNQVEYLSCMHVELHGIRPSKMQTRLWIKRLSDAYDKGIITKEYTHDET